MLKAILYVVTWLFILHVRFCMKASMNMTVLCEHEPLSQISFNQDCVFQTQAIPGKKTFCDYTISVWVTVSPACLAEPWAHLCSGLQVCFQHQFTTTKHKVWLTMFSGNMCQVVVTTFYWWLCFLNMSHNLNACWNVGLYYLLSSLPLCT